MTELTVIYFVRHAEPDLSNHDDAYRGLTEKGLADRGLVTEFLADKNISAVLSSPYKRAVDTVKELADLRGLPVIAVDDFRERKVGNREPLKTGLKRENRQSASAARKADDARPYALLGGLTQQTACYVDFLSNKVFRGDQWIEDSNGFCKRQWSDFDYKLSDGESLREVQRRNVAALQRVLREYSGESIVIGTHGTALSTIINFYDSSFGYEQFSEIKGLMPWLVCMKFDGITPVEIIKRNLFEN